MSTAIYLAGWGRLGGDRGSAQAEPRRFLGQNYPIKNRMPPVLIGHLPKKRKFTISHLELSPKPAERVVLLFRQQRTAEKRAKCAESIDLVARARQYRRR